VALDISIRLYMNSTLPPEDPHAAAPSEQRVAAPQPADKPDRKDGIAKMFGEFFREAAVLAFVFIPLDLLINQRPVTIVWGVTIVVVPMVFFAVGVYLERTRRE
jgi:hypothetical protein